MNTQQRDSKEGLVSPAKVTCSFSIERILKQDEKRDKQEKSEHGSQERYRENPEQYWTHDECLTSISHSPSPFRSYPVHPHPICPIPAATVIHPDSFYNYFLQRNIANCCTLSPLHKRMIERTCSPRSNGFAYAEETFRYVRDKDLSTSVGNLHYKQPIDNEDQHDSKRKGGQVRFSHVQSVELERIFGHQKYISPQERKQLSRYLHLSERQVKTWFQNRRAKWRRIKMETEMRQRLSHETTNKNQEHR